MAKAPLTPAQRTKMLAMLRATGLYDIIPRNQGARTPRPPRASSTSMGGGGGVQGMSGPRPSSTSMGAAGTYVQGMSGPRTKPSVLRTMNATLRSLKPSRGK